MKMLCNCLVKKIAKLIASQSGSFALNFALIFPVLLGLVASGVDFMGYNQQKSNLQSAADAAALAAVREASLKGWSSAIADSIAQSVVDSNVGDLGVHTVSTAPNETARKITVTIEQDHYPYFTMSMFPSPQIKVEATATAAGSANICVIGLNTSQPETLSLEGEALLTAPGCAVYSNSNAVDGIAAVQDSRLDAELTCSVGGVKRKSGNFAKEPITNCPPIADPLAQRPAPLYSTSCDHTNYALKGMSASTTLKPGVYCGGLSLGANVAITLEKGIYIIKDGPLTLGSNASLYGRGAGFYFTGTGADFSLESGSTVDLEAPESGELAGLIFFQDRNAAEANFLLRSNKASVLVGTIYLPNGNFIIDTVSKVADESAYTAIVTRTLSLLREPNVVLNTNYGATNVPVPAGIDAQDGKIRLLN